MTIKLRAEEIRKDIRIAIGRHLEEIRKIQPKSEVRHISINSEIENLIANHTIEQKEKMHSDISQKEFRHVVKEREKIGKQIRNIAKEELEAWNE